MKKTSSTTKKAAASHQRAFEEIVDLIERSRLHAVQAVNTTLIDLYWNVGKYISSKIQSEGWGKGTVLSLDHTTAQGLQGRFTEDLIQHNKEAAAGVK